jgi:nicotinamidase-related amidase
MAGLWTEVCLAQAAISALADGYRVFVVSDCSGGLTDESHEDAKRRLVPNTNAGGNRWRNRSIS